MDKCSVHTFTSRGKIRCEKEASGWIIFRKLIIARCKVHFAGPAGLGAKIYKSREEAELELIAKKLYEE